MITLTRSAAAGRAFSLVSTDSGFAAVADELPFAEAPTFAELLVVLDAEHRAVLPYDLDVDAAAMAEHERRARSEATVTRNALRKRQERLLRVNAPESVVLAAGAELVEAEAALLAPVLPPRREALVPVRLRGAPPDGPPEVGLWVGYAGAIVTQRAGGVCFAEVPSVLDDAPPGLRAPGSVVTHLPVSWPLRTVWSDPHVDLRRFIAVFATSARWSVDPDGVRALDGVALLDLDTGAWLDAIPERMQLCQVLIPANVAGGALAWFYVDTGIVEVEDPAGELEAWDPAWCTPDGRATGRVGHFPTQGQALSAPSGGAALEVGPPGASRARRGASGWHAHLQAPLVVDRTGQLATSRRDDLPALRGDALAFAFSPNFDAPAVMTATDVRLLWEDFFEEESMTLSVAAIILV